MRIIHIRFENYDNLSFRVDGYGGPRGHHRYIISRKPMKEGSGQIVLVNPVLKRTIVRGVHLVDQWGSKDKWFSETDSSTFALW